MKTPFVSAIFAANLFVILLFLFTVLSASSLGYEAWAIGGISADTLELQKLVQQSQQQIEAAKELIKYSKHDDQSLERATEILENLAKGLNQSIAAYQGTPAFEKALLKLQAERQALEPPSPNHPDGEDDKVRVNLTEFQAQSMNANRTDLESQEKLAQALKTAGSGFVPKLQAQAQLGSWQTSTRMSTQLTELLAAINGVRKDLNAHNQDQGLQILLKGGTMQNNKARERLVSHVAD